MSFDNGMKKANGQHERYQVRTDGDYVTPIRNTYIHKNCGSSTWCGDDIAETYAKNPSFYIATFCAACKNHYPLSEFKWSADGIQLGQLGGIAGQDLRSSGSNYIR